ncbi:MAG TPA: PQQ-binding-like beta-propeller repeat protein [Rhizomicrobium sp.]|nr:PQQ-binding-like beta-propeller repeat protein [Rhizomicrobium sp.]
MPPRFPSEPARRFRTVVPTVMGVALLALAGTAALANGGNWSEFGFAAKGGRYNPHEHTLTTTNVGGLKVLWSVQDDSFPFTAPAVVDGVVYSGTNAFDAATGQLLWATNSGGISPAITKGTVYIDTQNGLCAYAAADGTNLWCAENNYLPDAPSGAAVVDGIAYFGSALGSVFAIDAATGAQLWSAPISADNAASSPAVANGAVYINGDKLFSFDAKTGAQLWSSSILDGTSSPAVAGGVVYCSGRGALAAFNATTGAVLWSVSPGGPLSIIGDSPAVAKGVVYAGASVVGQHGSVTGTLYALKAHSGEVIWSAPVASGITSSPAVANGVVYVGSDDGTLYAFDAKTGAELAVVAGVAGQSSPTVANGMVYSETTVSGELFALGLGTP